MSDSRTALRYLNQEDSRDIRNLDKILSDPKNAWLFSDAPLAQDMRKDLWGFFRKLRVRLDRAGDKTVAFQPVKRMGRLREKARKEMG